MRILKLFGNKDADQGLHHRRRRAGILPDRQELLLRPPRPDHLRPHALRRPAAQGPGAGRPVLRLDPRARARVHGRVRGGAVQARRAGQDAPQRGRPEPVRDRPDLREQQPRDRPPEPDHGGPAQDRRPLRPGLPAAREAVRRHQRLAASTTTGRCRPTPARTCSTPATTRTTTRSSSSSRTAVIRAVAKYSEILRLSIASAHNDHRLGANEAPPAIISIFLGDQLNDVFEQIEKGGAKSSQAGRHVRDRRVACSRRCRRKPATATAPRRSRSPATSSSSAPSAARPTSPAPNTVLNTIVAESLDFIATKLEARRQGRQGPEQGDPGAAAGDHQGEQEGHLQRQRLLRGVARRGREARPAEPEEHRRRAAGHHPQGHDRAVQRSTRSTREKELESRFNILSEAYVKTINIEANTALMMAKTMILPAALRYQKEVGESIAAAKAAGVGQPAGLETFEHAGQRDQRLPDGDHRAREGPGPPRRRRRPTTTRSTCASDVFPALNDAPHGGRQAGDASSPTTSGRCRRTARCCSSSNARSARTDRNRIPRSPGCLQPGFSLAPAHPYPPAHLSPILPTMSRPAARPPLRPRRRGRGIASAYYEAGTILALSLAVLWVYLPSRSLEVRERSLRRRLLFPPPAAAGVRAATRCSGPTPKSPPGTRANCSARRSGRTSRTSRCSPPGSPHAPARPWYVHGVGVNLAAVLPAVFTYLFCRRLGLGRIGVGDRGMDVRLRGVLRLARARRPLAVAGSLPGAAAAALAVRAVRRRGIAATTAAQPASRCGGGGAA